MSLFLTCFTVIISKFSDKTDIFCWIIAICFGGHFLFGNSLYILVLCEFCAIHSCSVSQYGNANRLNGHYTIIIIFRYFHRACWLLLNATSMQVGLLSKHLLDKSASAVDGRCCCANSTSASATHNAHTLLMYSLVLLLSTLLIPRPIWRDEKAHTQTHTRIQKRGKNYKALNTTVHNELQCPLIAIHICTNQQPAINHIVKNRPYNWYDYGKKLNTNSNNNNTVLDTNQPASDKNSPTINIQSNNEWL